MTPLEALAKARAAWEASQPQLPLDLWGEDDGELGETACGGAAVSPSPPRPPTDGVGCPRAGSTLAPNHAAVTAPAAPPVQSLPPAGGSGPS